MLWMLTGCRISPKRDVVIVSAHAGVLRGCIREKMENVREPRCTGCPDLTAFYWRSEGDELDMFECFGFVVMYVAAAGCAAICFELCCLIVGEIFPSLPS